MMLIISKLIKILFLFVFFFGGSFEKYVLS